MGKASICHIVEGFNEANPLPPLVNRVNSKNTLSLTQLSMNPHVLTQHLPVCANLVALFTVVSGISCVHFYFIYRMILKIVEGRKEAGKDHQ